MSTDFKIRSVGSARLETVHALRKTHKGVKKLLQSNRFRPYMQETLDKKMRPFVSWDGEGWTDRVGNHRYMLLQNSLGGYIHAPLLGSIDCLNFILETATDYKKSIHVIFGGGYDATHILRDMPEEKKRELTETGETVWSIPRQAGQNRNRYWIKYIPHKWLEISGFDWKNGVTSYVKIYDVMTFFQSSFMAALESRGIEVPEVIASGKAARADFSYEDLHEIREYCQMELELLVELCETLRGEFEEAGISVTQWHGPGAVATALFKQEDIEEHKMAPPPDVEDAAQHAYFGGRFEQFGAGHYDGKVYQYDINSAYPDKISKLPSFKNARWVKTDVYDPEAVGVWYCSYTGNSLTEPHPIPWRGKEGVVGFPAHVAGVWLWHPEAALATEVHHGFILEIHDYSKPFGFIAGMYKKRQKWKKLERGGEKALKLGMNSIYGKLCQAIGGQEKYDGRPRWHQLEWAGMITSATRAQIWEAIKHAPDQIIAIETDSVASKVPLPLDVGEGLGQWELKTYDWITYVQSGIYFTSGADGATKGKAKTRGIDVSQLHHKDVLEHLDSGGKTPLRVTTRMFIGLTNPRKYLYGQWTDGVKDVKISGSKRLHMKHLCPQCKQGLSMATHLHTLSSAPHYGHVPSTKHKLPWIDGPAPQEDAELSYVGSDAIEEWDLPRRVLSEAQRRNLAGEY